MRAVGRRGVGALGAVCWKLISVRTYVLLVFLVLFLVLRFSARSLGRFSVRSSSGTLGEGVRRWLCLEL